MSLVSVNFENTVGRIKPMHATNNGPIGRINNVQMRWGSVTELTRDRYVIGANIYEFAMAGIPYARMYDFSHVFVKKILFSSEFVTHL